MEVVWARGRATADEVCRSLARRRLKNATVRTLLRRIEEKGYVHHELDGRTYVYSATVRPEQAGRGALRKLIDRFYGGSAERLVAGLLDGRFVDRRTLEDLARRLDAAGSEDDD
jgi:predicted transcriptional regulator